MGEIGIPRSEYLYELNYCDLLMIERGYERRHRHLWSTTRWQTFSLMSATAGSKAMNEAGYRTPKDLIKFPWDNEGQPSGLPSQEDVAELQGLMESINNKPKNEDDDVQPNASFWQQ